ncbi:D-alanyl-D-alanine carboxypeptidase family protein [Alicyclobacillus cycloheptanicus]|uniref:D-alanyl-D-alanine carboxypeptidase (Penicillin-binding protein 5/6) n=1 Tax=Alicyclobacillus cycloheptanicus TaxID=1457 RepID=A0ABT9XDR7_9BACL|nr:D-alanyl-D-alanine carboxypeptidase family protein [Alicyclobacillus cycloheptanicus]MDQ0188441.1 D-alanyl-D-alanine carboxypeptidase (penicillin-binding protein 5/6) [Alicyclobacillus cycloheptanicus]
MKTHTTRTLRNGCRRFICGGVVAGFVTCWGMPAALAASTSVYAAQGSGQPVVIDQTTENGVPMTADPVGGWPAIVSQAAVVMDMNTGTVVYAKNPLAPHYPASLTKILTAMIALQRGHLTDVLTTSAEAANQPPDKLYLVPGEVEPLEKLLYGMMLISANDVAVEIAQQYGGSVAGFAKLMNQEAQSLGAEHSHFVNPNGLPNPNHVTTAYDMAVITRAAMQIPMFRQIVDTRSYNWHGQAWSSHLTNINQMLFSYPGAIGVKTGFTSVAHETLAVAATHGRDTFLAVLLDAPTTTDIDHDATQLLDFAFSHYQTDTVIAKGTRVGTLPDAAAGSAIPVVTSEPVLATEPVGTHPAPATRVVVHPPSGAAPKGTVVGKLSLKSLGQAESVPVTLAGRYLPPPSPGWWTWRHILYVVVAVLAAGFITRGSIRRRIRVRRMRYGPSFRK